MSESQPPNTPAESGRQNRPVEPDKQNKPAAPETAGESKHGSLPADVIPYGKNRRRFFLFAILLAACVQWLFADFYIPDTNGTRISARPVPARPFILEDWLEIPPMIRHSESATLQKGDNLISVLTERGVDTVIADAAMDALREKYDARQLRDGQNIRLFFQRPMDAPAEAAEFAGLDFIPAPTQRIIVRRLSAERFQAVTAHRPLTDRPFLTDTLIDTSLYEAARASGMSPRLVVELTRLFIFTVDFQREIRQGDRLEVLYTRRFDSDGRVADEGQILFAALTNRGTRKAYWRFAEEEENVSGYYDSEGRSMERLLMKTPLDGARLSSRYGLRKHPILGFTRLHRGVDFAARRGTPIFAAGDGMIIAQGWDDEQGRRMIIRHANGYKTVYAHLRDYHSDMRVGRQVRQGQIIGYVGTSGLATGPHLHFEVHKNDRPVNPLTADLPVRRVLPEHQHLAFTQMREHIDKLAHDLAAGL